MAGYKTPTGPSLKFPWGCDSVRLSFYVIARQREETGDRAVPPRSRRESSDVFRHARGPRLSDAAGRVVGAVGVQTEHASLEREMRHQRRS